MGGYQEGKVFKRC